MALCLIITSANFNVSLAKVSRSSGALKAQLVLDGKNTKKTVSYLNVKGKIYVSLQDTFSDLGGKCTFNGKNAVAKRGKDTIKVATNNRIAFVNSKRVSLSSLPKFVSKKIYVPVDFLNEAIDGKISFNSSNKTLNVKTKMSLLFTKGFSITYLKGGVKRVVDGDKRTLILVPRGKAVPSEYRKNIIINTPIKNIFVGSTIQGCLLRPLKVTPSISCVTTKQNQWHVSEVANAMKSGKIKYVGENTAPDYEKIAAIKPEMAFVYSGYYGMQPVMKKFNELKIKYAVENGYLEENPLGRMEWMKFVAAFYNKEDAAENYFNQAVNRVNAIKRITANRVRPTVAWAMVYKGEVYIANPGSYVTKMIEMAGGNYIFNNVKAGSGKISLEEFYAKAKNADILIYSSLNQYSPTLKSVIDEAPILANMKAVKNKNVWCFHPDYYQTVDKTDELISDLLGVFKTGNYKVKHFIRYTK